MALNSDGKFEGNMTFAFKSGMRNLANFHQSMLGSLNIGTFMVTFYPKQKMYELKINRPILCYDYEKFHAKFDGNMTCAFKKDLRTLAIFNRGCSEV